MHKGSKVFRRIVSGLTAAPMVALAVAGAIGPATAQSDRKSMTCKLSSEKVVGGRERQCLYVCEDKSLEGRTRSTSSSCPRTVQSGGR
jgi:hypothetical protein